MHGYNLFPRYSEVAIWKGSKNGDEEKKEASSNKRMSSVRHKSGKKLEILSKMRKEDTNQKALTKPRKQLL